MIKYLYLVLFPSQGTNTTSIQVVNAPWLDLCAEQVESSPVPAFTFYFAQENILKTSRFGGSQHATDHMKRSYVKEQKLLTPKIKMDY